MENGALSITKDGDRELAVAYSDKCDTFIVSSTAMSLASPVWNKIMNPPFGGETDRGKRISFTDDNAEALLVLLYIAHLRFIQVPPKVTFSTLFNILVLCDQYDCIDITQPWMSIWLKGAEKLAGKPHHEEWLFIAWALGKEEIFKSLAVQLVTEVSVNDAGNCLLPTGEILPSPMPPGIVESILSTRHAVITRLVAITYTYVNRFLKDPGYVCRRPKSQSQCDAFVFGTLILGLQKLHLWPERGDNINGLSIEVFASTVESLVPSHWTGVSYLAESSNPGEMGKVSSHFCGKLVSEYQTEIADAIKSIPSPVLKSHLRHIQTQKEKMGKWYGKTAHLIVN
ncbi:MAG: hypothetical protein M1840_004351 [Geoglossum simile]|nr:MAG: hypothetical protein M1840_004351 [Geoglossum simile]